MASATDEGVGCGQSTGNIDEPGHTALSGWTRWVPVSRCHHRGRRYSFALTYLARIILAAVW
jgi:hypothetical protein